MENYNYCPKCSSPVKNKIIDNRDRIACSSSSCNFVFWNNPTPVVCGIVETNAGVVLAKNNAWSENNYSLIAGFLEAGEAPTDAIVRECQEELNLTATNPYLVGVYTFPKENQIVLVYHVDAHGEIKPNEEIHSCKIISKQDLERWGCDQGKPEGWTLGFSWAIKDWLLQQNQPAIAHKISVAPDSKLSKITDKLMVEHKQALDELK